MLDASSSFRAAAAAAKRRPLGWRKTLRLSVPDYRYARQLRRFLLPLEDVQLDEHECQQPEKGVPEIQEITDETLEKHADTIFHEAENRLHVQKAAIAWMLR